MNDIIEKMEKINNFIFLMDNDNQIKFMTNENKLIIELEKNIDTLYKKMLCYNLSKDEHKEISIKNKKNKIIAKSLFPCYWMLTECLDRLPNDEIIKNYECDESDNFF
jgi:hypothetical protein